MSSAGRSDKTDLTARLIGHLKELISQGVLAPGAKLPPERELCEAFGVSRSSLRHALKALQVMGVVRQRVGDGTYLVESADRVLQEPLDLMILIDGISLDDLMETRLIVEPELAARAAERATLEDLARMREALDRMRRQKEPEQQIQGDLAFHRSIFAAARNRICQRVFSLLHQAMLTSMGVTARLVDWKHTLAYHEPIYEAIERRQPEEARQRMLEHLRDARSLLSQAQHRARWQQPAAVLRPPRPLQ